ncbi:MAG: L,D-transpeptidase family protein [Deltaproteobacteria bacterium]|nr:L,D-transpeptidase family protein [Deltaproteobacteria bacterium]
MSRPHGKNTPQHPFFSLLLAVCISSVGCAVQIEPRPSSTPKLPPRVVSSPCGSPAAEAALISASVVALSSDKESLQLQHSEVVDEVYLHGKAAARFVTLRGLTPAGRHLRDHLASVGDHGLAPKHFHHKRVAQLVGGLTQHAQDLPVDCRRASRVSAQVELLLADALLSYTHHQSRAYTKVAELRAKWRKEDQVSSLEDAKTVVSASGKGAFRARQHVSKAERIQARLIADLRHVKDVGSLKELLAEVKPAHPQYDRLVRAHAHYRTIVGKGGWKKVKRVKGMLRGQRHADIIVLKERLAAEGYFHGVLNRLFDQALEEAIRSYQSTHQMSGTGRPDKAFWRSVNVPASHRLQAIGLTLQRWRESAVGASDYFVLVNVPDFHLEVWKKGKRLLRRKVVVGKNYGTTCDERTHRRVLAHATPLLSARLERLIFSPFWNVPRNIKEKEFDPEDAKTPLYYKKRGYELLNQGTPQERVRRLPGPRNALGFVKFLFPNNFSTYLHDTPQKWAFKRPVRAFSHGCTRVQGRRALRTIAKTLACGGAPKHGGQVAYQACDAERACGDSCRILCGACGPGRRGALPLRYLRSGSSTTLSPFCTSPLCARDRPGSASLPDSRAAHPHPGASGDDVGVV